MTDTNEDVTDYQEDELYGDEEFNQEEYQGEDGEGIEEIQSEEMKKRVLEMEEELDKLTKMQQQVEKQITSASDRLDENSIYVGQVDYEASPEELRGHFSPCGTINRVTIMCDKLSGQPKGFAYIEFVDKESVENALKLDDSQFRGRQLKVLPKRQNVPAATAMRGRGRGRGIPIAGGGRSGIRGGGRGYMGGRVPYSFPRGGGRGPPRGGRFRGRGAPAYFNSYY